MTFESWAAFTAASAVLLIIPGPTVLLVVSYALGQGWRTALPMAVGVALGDFTAMTLSMLGLGALLAASEFWFTVLKYVGAVYLAWLGVMLLRSKGGFQVPADGAPIEAPSSRSIFMKSFLVAVTNPKGYLFCSALLPQFIDPAAAQAPQYITIAIVFAGLDFAVMLGYAIAGAHAVRVMKASATKWLDRICGGALLALAGSLAFYRRANS